MWSAGSARLREDFRHLLACEQAVTLGVVGIVELLAPRNELNSLGHATLWDETTITAPDNGLAWHAHDAYHPPN